MAPVTLASIALDLQIIICTLLHPSAILALRETCKTLQLPTRRRVVWVAALRRICLENSLFLPSFPILDMSDAELEHAAMAPCRWIELSASFQKQHHNGSDTELRPRTTRIIEDSLPMAALPGLFIVPGGRYMVNHSLNGISVWDLGYTSSADCKLIASVGLEGGADFSCMVQATPDGMGLEIFSSLSSDRCSVYEIYPQSETPQLTRIAHLDFNDGERATFLPDRVLWYDFDDADRIVFIVWDYRKNHSISLLADVDVKRLKFRFKVMTTKTAIIILCQEGILVWAIPPLLPQPPDFLHHNITHIPSPFRIAFPDDILSHSELYRFQMMSHWYCGSSQPLYFDMVCGDLKLHRFEIIVKPDLVDTTLHLIKTELVSDDFLDSIFETYSTCEDTLVACWENEYRGQFGAYTGLTSSRFATVISHGVPVAKMLFPATVSATECTFCLCPTSGRYAYLDKDNYRIVVVDLF